MTVESATYISDLNASYPAATDGKVEGDDHIRLVKTTVKATFPNVAGAVTPTHTELNYVDGVTSAIQTQLDAKAPSNSPTLVTPALGTPSSGVLTNCTGTAAGLTAGNVTTNANLTGHITSVGNAAVLGSFTSAQLAAALTDETGSGANVFATSPTLVTPVLGVATGTSFQGIIGNVTPAAGTFTTLTSTGNAALGDAEATDTHAIKGATTVLANSASAALTVTQTGAGNAFVVEDSASTDSTPFVIDNGGAVGVGGAPDYVGKAQKVLVTDGTYATIFVEGTSTTAIVASQFSTNATGASYQLRKSRGSVATPTVVADGDDLGMISFQGYDGGANRVAASILGEVDGTPGASDMPGRLVFSTTADGAASPTERMRIDSTGLVKAPYGVVITGPGNLGYATGSGGAVTQATSRTTGVTLNKTNGAITLFTDAGSATAAQFTVTNSTVATTDTVALSVKSATNKYLVSVTAVAAGSFEISFQTTGGTSSDAPVINFAVLKAVAA